MTQAKALVCPAVSATRSPTISRRVGHCVPLAGFLLSKNIPLEARVRVGLQQPCCPYGTTEG